MKPVKGMQKKAAEREEGLSAVPERICLRGDIRRFKDDAPDLIEQSALRINLIDCRRGTKTEGVLYDRNPRGEKSLYGKRSSLSADGLIFFRHEKTAQRLI